MAIELQYNAFKMEHYQLSSGLNSSTFVCTQSKNAVPIKSNWIALKIVFARNYANMRENACTV